MSAVHVLLAILASTNGDLISASNGDDIGGDGTASKPYRTIEKAFEMIVSSTTSVEISLSPANSYNFKCSDLQAHLDFIQEELGAGQEIITSSPLVSLYLDC
jgi:hypothetical protein